MAATSLKSSNSFENNPNLSENHSDLLLDIKTKYENMFSWDVYKTIGKDRKSGTDFLRKILHKHNLVFHLKGFDFDQFCLSLIRCFEMFLNSELTEALSEIYDLILTLKPGETSPYFKQISDVCFHIAYSTQAYIMLQLGSSPDDVQDILANIKSKSNFSTDDEAAINAIKSRIFVKYSPEGNEIALEFAETAKNLNDKEPFWITIWLKAIRHIRRYEQKLSLPFSEELNAARKLRAIDGNYELILSAASVYAEFGFALYVKPSNSNLTLATGYQKSSALMVKRVLRNEEDKENLKLYYICLLILNNLPTTYIPENIYDTLVKNLIQGNKNKDNYKINNVLGKYYMRIEDLETAREYFERSSSVGSLNGSIMLLRAECYLKSVDDFPVASYLKNLYNSYTCPKRRRHISAQTLLYYMYIEETDKKELLYSLASYLNDHIDCDQKKNYISRIFPVFKLKKSYKAQTFIDDLTANVEQLKTYTDWNLEDKKALDEIVLKLAVHINKKMVLNSVMGCVVCQVDKACMYFEACGHRCVCEDCWGKIRIINRKCPICRDDVNLSLNC